MCSNLFNIIFFGKLRSSVYLVSLNKSKQLTIKLMSSSNFPHLDKPSAKNLGYRKPDGWIPSNIIRQSVARGSHYGMSIYYSFSYLLHLASAVGSMSNVLDARTFTNKVLSTQLISLTLHVRNARRRNTQCRAIARHLYSVARREILTKRNVGNDLHFLRRKIWISGTVISNDNTKSVFLHFVGSNITDRLILISTTLPKTPKKHP